MIDNAHDFGKHAIMTAIRYTALASIIETNVNLSYVDRNVVARL